MFLVHRYHSKPSYPVRLGFLNDSKIQKKLYLCAFAYKNIFIAEAANIHKNFQIFTGKLCWSLFTKKKTLTQMFFCEYCEIFRNIYFEEHLQTAASVISVKELFCVDLTGIGIEWKY